MAACLDLIARLFACESSTCPGIYLIGYECWGYVPQTQAPEPAIQDSGRDTARYAPAVGLTA